MVGYLQSQHDFSERRACKAVSQPRSVQRYQAQPDNDDELIKALLAAVERYPDRGFPKLFQVLRAQQA